jgi:hypothetical protein
MLSGKDSLINGYHAEQLIENFPIHLHSWHTGKGNNVVENEDK